MRYQMTPRVASKQSSNEASDQKAVMAGMGVSHFLHTIGLETRSPLDAVRRQGLPVMRRVHVVN